MQSATHCAGKESEVTEVQLAEQHLRSVVLSLSVDDAELYSGIENALRLDGSSDVIRLMSENEEAADLITNLAAVMFMRLS